MIGISFAASSICLSSISVKPVVPIINGFLYSLASWTRDIVDSGLEKSITTSESKNFPGTNAFNQACNEIKD